MRIGDIGLSSKVPLFLAPMAGYTNIAMREMMARMGADVVYTELASAAALAREYKLKTGEAKATQKLIRAGNSGITGIQIFGANKEEITGAIKFIEEWRQTQEYKPRFIDLNLGCPATKVCTIGAGSELLKEPAKLEHIVESAVRSSDLPITVKMRLLPSIDEGIKIAKMFEKKGVSALAIHGRTQKQKFGGFANWGAIRQIKESVNIPIIGNGDVKTVQNAQSLLRISKCDGIMVGRAALENPFIFLQLRNVTTTKTPKSFGVYDKLDYLRDYFALCEKYDVAFVEAKELSIQLVSGVRGAASIRNSMVRAESHAQLLNIFEQVAAAQKRR
ncbi:MAG: tRNA-dihydrouridine synthase family protein [Candidatus Micrarchaeia archaeon]